jgi:hypothetical protein
MTRRSLKNALSAVALTSVPTLAFAHSAGCSAGGSWRPCAGRRRDKPSLALTVGLSLPFEVVRRYRATPRLIAALAVAVFSGSRTHSSGR